MPDFNAAKSVYQYLLAENIHIDFDEFVFQAKTHPDYPAVLAYSDTLHFFGISNIALRLTNEQVSALPQQFMALMVDFDEQEMLAFVQRKDDKFQFVKNGKLLTFDMAQFEQNWKNVILLVEGKEETAPTKPVATKNKYWLLLLGLLLLLEGLFWAVGLTVLPTLFLLTICIGLYLSVLAIKAALGVTDANQSAFCKGLPQSDCNAVISKGKGLRFTNIQLSDVCIVFFTAQLTILFLFMAAGWLPAFYTLGFISLIAAVPVTIYSLYFQAAVAKTWCAICLSVIALLYVQLGLAWWAPRVAINYQLLPQALLYIAIFVLALAGWLLLKPWLLKYKTLQTSLKKATTFKKNYQLFRYLLQQNKQIDFATADTTIVLGNATAPLRITLVTNLFCGHCVGAHRIMVQLLHTYGEQLGIGIRFNYASAANETQQQLYQQLVILYQQQGATAFTDALSDWFEHKQEAQWLAKYGQVHELSNEIEMLLQHQSNWNLQHQLNFTPALFIGPYLFPTEYDREELLHFIPELIEDKTLTVS